ncbi:MAG: PQQ-dependent dehydrogenase, methanol/ethanol family [Acidobacteriota bacterium]|nr:PQQ-dependent dehydrogenase, methanol/ethanol family [Acidobacteriota bacterium]
MKRISVLLALVLAACGGSKDSATDANAVGTARASRGPVNDARISSAAANEPGSWLSYGMDYREQRFSQLTQITRDNVAQLGLAWHREIGGARERMQGTPLVVDGVMYASNGWSEVYALNARTGDEIWHYDPQTDREFVKYSCCGGVVNRGVAVYEGKVFVATFDGRLIAIDQASGEEVWDVDTWHPTALGRFNITGAPRAAVGLVFIGQGSSESGHRRGYVTAYNADTGEVAWRFYLVPGDPSQPFEHPELEMAAETWGGEWWKYGGGGTAWNSLVYDEELGNLYIGVGNGAPWPREIRSPGGGDDLFLTAVVAVDAATGEMKWYYQTVPGDNWDYSAAMDIALGEMDLDGVPTKVLLQAPKNGFFYVIDRTNGKLLRAHPYTERIDWATHVDMETGRPIENPETAFENNPQWIYPANAGAHNWEPMSFDQSKGIMYFYYHDFPNFYGLDESFVKTGKYKINPWGLSLGVAFGPYRQELERHADPQPPSKGYLVAFDPLSGEHLWKNELPSTFNGGVLATTTGVLFQGDGLGMLSAYNSDDGSRIWEFDGYGNFSSSMMTYELDGEQYLAGMVSGNLKYDTRGKLLVFKLGADADYPEPPLRDLSIPEQPPVTASQETLNRGNALYHQHCAICHRGLGVASIVATASPDLRRMSAETQAQFSVIVRVGTKAQLGMPSFGDMLDEEATMAIKAFVSTEAAEAREAQLAREQTPPG